MKKLALFAVALLFLTGAGCQTIPTVQTEENEVAPTPIENQVPLSNSNTSIPAPASNSIQTSVTVQ
jgi:hypothetical protein